MNNKRGSILNLIPNYFLLTNLHIMKKIKKIKQLTEKLLNTELRGDKTPEEIRIVVNGYFEKTEEIEMGFIRSLINKILNRF
jgi:hypothetical protein